MLIGWDFLQYANFHAPCKLLLDLLLPVHRDGGRGMDSLRDNVRPQRVSEGRPGHLRQGLVGAHVHCGGGVMLGDVLLGHGSWHSLILVGWELLSELGNHMELEVGREVRNLWWR